MSRSSLESEANSPKRVLGAFPSFASQGEDVASVVSFQNSLGIYGMAVLKYGKDLLERSAYSSHHMTQVGLVKQSGGC
jgi:hypothetical protein